mgnify:CR=1 FL=1
MQANIQCLRVSVSTWLNLAVNPIRFCQFISQAVPERWRPGTAVTNDEAPRFFHSS